MSRQLLLSYYQLCKPKVLYLMITTSWVGMYLSGEPYPGLLKVGGISLGIFLIAAFGAVLNQLFEQSIDAKMQRTSSRPLVKKTVSQWTVLLFSFVLFLLGTFFLLFFANGLTALLTVAGSLGYAFIYTLFLKPRTAQNIVIGGLYGALPPLLGWVSLSNAIDPQALLLPLIIFTWTPPHFWALAIHRVKDYTKVGLPMMPVTYGIPLTTYFIFLYTILLTIVCLLPYLTGLFSTFYLVMVMVLNVLYFVYNIRIFFNPHVASLKSFHFSIVYLYATFLLMVIDKW